MKMKLPCTHKEQKIVIQYINSKLNHSHSVRNAIIIRVCIRISNLSINEVIFNNHAPHNYINKHSEKDLTRKFIIYPIQSLN